MDATTKKCPMCAEQIPLEAKVCEFFGTQFERTNSGLSTILFFTVISILLLAGCNPSPASQVPSETISVTPTIAITSTPTFVPTFTPSPTATATQLPSWVTDFAEPILSAIADTPPRVDDDMNDNSGGWDVADWCGGRGSAAHKFINGEFVLDNCVATRSKMAYTDFVLEIDVRFLEESWGIADWTIGFRDAGFETAYSLHIGADGSISLQAHHYPGGWMQIAQIGWALPSKVNHHYVLIVKGSRIALYLDRKPLYYIEDETVLQRGSISFSAEAPWHGDWQYEGSSIIALDNLKVWDISDISIP